MSGHYQHHVGNHIKGSRSPEVAQGYIKQDTHHQNLEAKTPAVDPTLEGDGLYPPGVKIELLSMPEAVHAALNTLLEH